MISNELYTEEDFSSLESTTTSEENSSISPQRMAAMVGFDRSASDRQADTDADIATGLAATTSEPEAEAHSARTQRSFHHNPFAKAALVGISTFTVAVLASSLFVNPFGQQANQSTPSTTASTPTPQPSDTAQEAPNGKVLSELALSKQEQEIDTFNRKSQQPQQAQPITTASVAPTQPVTFSVPTAPPARAIAPLPQRQLSYPTFSAPPRPSFLAPTSIQRPTAPTPATPISAPPSDPTQEWLAAAQLGSYGQVSPPVQEATTPRQTRNSNTTTASALVAIDTTAEAPILTGQMRQPGKTIVVGTRAKGVLGTPVVWDASATTFGGSNRDRFVVVLQEPLKASDGSIALPAGTELITKLNSHSQGGLIDLSVVAGVVEIKGNRQEVRLPEAAILIHGKENKPLMAKLIRQKGNSLGRTLGQVALGAVRQAAALYTRPNSSVFYSNSGTTITNENPRANVLAGALQGGTSALINTLTAQNQAAIAHLQRQNVNSVWMAAAGTSVEIFFSQSVPIAGAIAEPASQLGSPLQLPAQEQNQPQQSPPDSTATLPSETLTPSLAATNLTEQSLVAAEVAINSQLPEHHPKSTQLLTWAGE